MATSQKKKQYTKNIKLCEKCTYLTKKWFRGVVVDKVDPKLSISNI
jgi:hypothetical protein